MRLKAPGGEGRVGGPVAKARDADDGADETPTDEVAMARKK